MNAPRILRFPPRPADLPPDARRLWPLVEVVSFVGLVSKPFIIAVIGLVWWSNLTLGIAIEVGATIGTAICVATLVACIPAIVGVYWHSQLLDAEERRRNAERRASRRFAGAGGELAVSAGTTTAGP